MKSHVTLPLLSLSAVAALSSFNVNAHGWVEFPSARQNTCYLDGGFGPTRSLTKRVKRLLKNQARTRLCNAAKLRRTYQTTATWHTFRRWFVTVNCVLPAMPLRKA